MGGLFEQSSLMLFTFVQKVSGNSFLYTSVVFIDRHSSYFIKHYLAISFMIVIQGNYLKPHIVFVDLKSFFHFQRNFIKNTIAFFVYCLGEMSEGQGIFVYPKECIFLFQK